MRLQKKEEDVPQSSSFKFWTSKGGKIAKGIFYFRPNSGQISWVSWVDRAIITVFLNVTWKRKYLSRFSLLYFIQVNKEIHWWLTPKTSHTSVDSAKNEKYVQCMDSHHSKWWSKGGKTSRGVLIFAPSSKINVRQLLSLTWLCEEQIKFFVDLKI